MFLVRVFLYFTQSLFFNEHDCKYDRVSLEGISNSQTPTRCGVNKSRNERTVLSQSHRCSDCVTSSTVTYLWKKNVVPATLFLSPLKYVSQFIQSHLVTWLHKAGFWLRNQPTEIQSCSSWKRGTFKGLNLSTETKREEQRAMTQEDWYAVLEPFLGVKGMWQKRLPRALVRDPRSVDIQGPRPAPAGTPMWGWKTKSTYTHRKPFEDFFLLQCIFFCQGKEPLTSLNVSILSEKEEHLILGHIFFTINIHLSPRWMILRILLKIWKTTLFMLN